MPRIMLPAKMGSILPRNVGKHTDASGVFKFVPGEVCDRTGQDVCGKCEQGSVQRSDNAEES